MGVKSNTVTQDYDGIFLNAETRFALNEICKRCILFDLHFVQVNYSLFAVHLTVVLS
jgi:hypothetical protein